MDLREEEERKQEVGTGEASFESSFEATGEGKRRD